MHTRCLFLFLIALMVLTPVATARSVIPQPWQRLVYDADFLGVVRCLSDEHTNDTKSFGHNNLFYDVEVIRPIKGGKAGEKFTFYAGTDDPGFDYGDPRAQEGKHYLLFGVVQFTREGDVPMPPAVFQQLWPALIPLDAEGNLPEGRTLSDYYLKTEDAPQTLPEFEKAGAAFLALPLNEQALIVMKGCAKAEIERANKDIANGERWLERLEQVKTTEQLVDLILACAEAEENASRVSEVLSLGQDACLKALEAQKARAREALGGEFERIVAELRWRTEGKPE